MGKSWDHYVRLLSDDEIEHIDRQLERTNHPQFYRCGTRRCESPHTHMVGYRYVTGRAGRVSSAEKRACPVHAQAFADKYGAPMPLSASERHEVMSRG